MYILKPLRIVEIGAQMNTCNRILSNALKKKNHVNGDSRSTQYFRNITNFLQLQPTLRREKYNYLFQTVYMP